MVAGRGLRGHRMIEFRCWYCSRRFVKSEKRIGERFTCNCRRMLRVPKRNGGYCRVKTLVDWMVEAVVYGGGGAGRSFVSAGFSFGQTPWP